MAIPILTGGTRGSETGHHLRVQGEPTRQKGLPTTTATAHSHNGHYGGARVPDPGPPPSPAGPPPLPRPGLLRGFI